MANILLVEDDVAISDLLKMTLQLVGHDCFKAYTGEEAVILAERCRPHLVLLDIMIPGTDGLTLLKQNAFRDTPVIFLTAKASLADKVVGLNAGADDYIVKPFETAELIARVEAVLRRTKSAENVFTLDGTTVHLDRHTVTAEGGEIPLTSREFELLEVLIRNRNYALSREKLLDLAWGYDYFGDSRTVDVHITKLRKKLGWENRIRTVYKLGYRLEVGP